MELKEVSKKVTAAVAKYKYAVAILAVGLVLMLLPTSSKDQTVVPEVQPTPQEVSLSEQLCSILKRIDGAGDVQVMLTVMCGEETVYYETEDITTSSDSSSVRRSVITVTDANKNQSGLIRYINSEKYLGAVIVCEGADSALVRESIIDAVSKATGLRSDKISVLKMK